MGKKFKLWDGEERGEMSAAPSGARILWVHIADTFLLMVT